MKKLLEIKSKIEKISGVFDDEDDYDIYIKDEGYADVKVGSQRAKKWCKENGYNNDGGNNYYQFALDLSQVEQFINKAEKSGLNVESEV